MSFTDQQRNGLDTLLNEADLLGFEVDPDRKIGSATFNILTLPEVGPAPTDSRYQLLLHPVTRVVASLRQTQHESEREVVKSFALEELLRVVESFGGQPIYGWEFFDVHDKTLAEIAGRVSLDWPPGNESASHSLSVFQSSDDRILDFCIWFDSLLIRNADGEGVPIDVAIEGAERWWERMYAGDPRTDGRGIVPGSEIKHQSLASELFDYLRDRFR